MKWSDAALVFVAGLGLGALVTAMIFIARS